MQEINSESNPTMIACKQFNEILNQIQHSGLNFQLQLSPFGAFISLRKSLVKDKKGDFIIPSSSIISGTLNNIEDLTAVNSKIMVLEKKLKKLQNDYVRVQSDCAAAHKVIESFAMKNECTAEIKTGIKVPEKKIEELEECTKQKNREYENKNKIKEKNTKNDGKEISNSNLKPEIETIEEDLNYNVEVSNSFSPLIQLEPETLSSKPSVVSLSSREPCISPSAPLNTPTSPCTPSTAKQALISSESPRTLEAASDMEEETVYFEGKLISKQDAFKKILEAVQDMNNNFNP